MEKEVKKVLLVSGDLKIPAETTGAENHYSIKTKYDIEWVSASALDTLGFKVEPLNTAECLHCKGKGYLID